MAGERYKWIVPEDIRSLGGVYDDCIQEFLESGVRSARVDIPGKKPKSTYLLLKKSLRKKGLQDKVSVCMRFGKVYLSRPE